MGHLLILTRIWIGFWLGLFWFLSLLRLLGIRIRFGIGVGIGIGVLILNWGCRIFDVVRGIVALASVAIAIESLSAVAVESTLGVLAGRVLVTDMGAQGTLVNVHTDLQAAIIQLSGESVMAVASEGVLLGNAHGVLHAFGGAIGAGIGLGIHSNLAVGANPQGFVPGDVVQDHVRDLLESNCLSGIGFVVAQATGVQDALVHLWRIQK